MAVSRNRKNIVLGIGLGLFAVALACSVFVYRYSHNQAPMPAGSSYGQTYHPTENPAGE